MSDKYATYDQLFERGTNSFRVFLKSHVTPRIDREESPADIQEKAFPAYLKVKQTVLESFLNYYMRRDVICKDPETYAAYAAKSAFESAIRWRARTSALDALGNINITAESKHFNTYNNIAVRLQIAEQMRTETLTGEGDRDMFKLMMNLERPSPNANKAVGNMT